MWSGLRSFLAGITATIPANSAAPRSAALAAFWEHFDAYFAPPVQGVPPIANVPGQSRIQPVPFPQNPVAPNPARPQYVPAQPSANPGITVGEQNGPYGFGYVAQTPATFNQVTANIAPHVTYSPADGLIWLRGNPYE